MIEKPKSMPLIDFFVKRTAIKTLVPESVTDLIVKDQWKNLHKATRSEIELEVTGLGYFKVSRNMASSNVKRLEKIIIRWENKVEDIKIEGKKAHTLSMINNMRKELDNYKSKLEQYENRFPRASTGNVQQTFRGEVEEESSIGQVP